MNDISFELQVKTLSEQGEAMVIVGEVCQALLGRGPAECLPNVFGSLVCGALDLSNLLTSSGSDCSHLIGLLTKLLQDPRLQGKLVSFIATSAFSGNIRS